VRRLAPGLLRPLRAAVCAACLALGSASAEDGDAERARQAVHDRRIVPLASILDWIEARYLGQAIEVELEDDEVPPRYEVEWLTPQGHVVEFEFDASSGELLEREGRGLDEARRP
jgi:uncharacterized membrane protein YkoI